MRCFIISIVGLLLLGAFELIASEEQGGVIGFVPKKGWSVSGDVGILLVEGGFRALTADASGHTFEPRSVACYEPTLGINVAYDVIDYFSIGLRLGSGFVSNAARVADAREGATHYSLVTANLVLTGIVPIYKRLLFEGRVFGGGTMINPPPLPDAAMFGYDVGAGLGLRFDTLLTNLMLGLDADVYMHFIRGSESSIIPGILSVAIAPVVKYVF